MIRHLIANDFRKMINILIYIYPFSIFFSLIARLCTLWDPSTLQYLIKNIFISLTFTAIVTILVNTFIQILRVFINNFYKDESYLTHTLPVTKNQLILSKYIASLLVIVISVAVSVLTLIIVLNGTGLMDLLYSAMQSNITAMDMPISSFFAIVSILLFLQICAIICFAFTAIIKGNMYDEKKRLKSLFWFVLYYFSAMLLVFLVVFVIFALQGNTAALFSQTIFQQSMVSIFVIAIVLYAIYAATFFLISKKLWSKGVNVD